VAPRPTLLLALLAPAGVLVAFPIWVGLAMALSVTVPKKRWDRGFLPPDPLERSTIPAPSPYAGRLAQ
jgi:hypothetical protein